jgi:hypothetical protein
MAVQTKTKLVRVTESRAELGPILAGRHTLAGEDQVRSFHASVADIFERSVTGRSSKHMQRAYRQDVTDFVEFLRVRGPDGACSEGPRQHQVHRVGPGPLFLNPQARGAGEFGGLTGLLAVRAV